ncbi:mucin-5AC-like [Argopecten irradians]|uniref:mucin-5AC-like n=1 Tax=Argopecten irradians TaxID=31199 RepID=UPI0037125C54
MCFGADKLLLLTLLQFEALAEVSFTTPKQSTQWDQYSYTLLSQYGYSVGTRTWIVLEVRSCEDAYFGLMKKNHVKNHGQIYEIVIGGWENTKICIRDQRQGDCRAEKTKSVLNCNAYVPFNVSWTDGTVVVHKDKNGAWNKLLSWTDTSPFTVQYVGVTTAVYAIGYWRIPEQEITTTSTTTTTTTTTTTPTTTTTTPTTTTTTPTTTTTTPTTTTTTPTTYHRSLTSAPDGRMSSRAIGYTAILTMVFTFGPPVLSDIFKLVCALKSLL